MVIELLLPMFREYHAEYAVKAMNESLSYEPYLFELAQIECEVRLANKIIRLVKASKLPRSDIQWGFLSIAVWQ